MTDVDYKRYTCGNCNTEFEWHREKRYCSKKCNKAFIRKNKASVPRAEYLAKVREHSACKFTCEQCGKEAHRKLSGTNKQRGIVNRFCDRACRMAHQAVEREKKEAIDKARRCFIKALKLLAKSRSPRPEQALYYTPKVRTCPCCGLQWSALTWCGPTDYCQTAECQKARKKAANKVSNSGKTHTGRAKRMGRKYGYFNVMRVFERDKWTCKLCGIKTPKKLRGTLDPRAPELDHIIPLSAGGDHLIENCQCACRKCNGEKSSRPAGQLILAGFGDTWQRGAPASLGLLP